MEGNLNTIPGVGSYGDLELQGSMRFNQQPHALQHHRHQHQRLSLHPSINDVFPPLAIGTMQDCDHHPISMVDYNTKGHDRVNKNVQSDEDEPSLTEDAVDCHNDSGKGKKGPPWQRVKWTDNMVKLLITAVSYVGEDTASDCGGGGKRKYALLQKKGKWKSVSKVMAERGYSVSPQQCEDKFNDLNKRYKRLNDVLGRGTSCQVVENPALLDVMNHLSEKVKDDVRKILSSKHLFYEEMCSYHNGNRLHLPPDPALQRSLQLALRSGEDIEKNDVRRHSHDDHDDEDEHDEETDEHDEFEGTHTIQVGSVKRMRQNQGFEEFSFKNPINSHEIGHVDMNQTLAEGSKASWMQTQWMKSRSIQLEEQKIELEMEMLELEKQRLKWQRFSKKKDRELEKMRMENERMKLENEQMTLELKLKGVKVDLN